MKKKSFYILLTLCLLMAACVQQNSSYSKYISINGSTMGTTYNVQYNDNLNRNFKLEFDSILYLINKSMSTYDPNSTISKFNSGIDSIVIDPHFEKVFTVSKKINKITLGYFNPTVYPLVKYWGFAGGPKPIQPDSIVIDSLLTLCDFNALNVSRNNDTVLLIRHKKKVQLDFSAVAKGYAVDLLGIYLKKQDINNYLVEIGGEVIYAGQNPEGENWSIGIDYPIIEGEQRELAAIVKSKANAIATSGNYRNFYIKDGQRYAHILNPNTGYSYTSNILSATVISENCIEADALATALMIGGKQLFDSLSNNSNYETLLIESFVDSSGREFLKPIMSKSLESKVEWLID